MKPLNLRRNRRKVTIRSEPRKAGFTTVRHNNKQFKRQVKGSVRTFAWKIFSSFKYSLVVTILLISVISYGAYWVFKNQYFQVKNYEVIGLNSVSEGAVLEALSETKGKWIFFISPSFFENKIIRTSNFIKSVYVEKILPDTLKIHIEERYPIAVWRTVNGSYLTDVEGYILKRNLSEDVTLDEVLSDIAAVSVDNVTDSIGEVEDSFLQMGEDVLENDFFEDEKVTLEEILDPELITQIEIDRKSRGNEQLLLNLDFDKYNVLPDSFKKYPQVKILSDKTYEVDLNIDWDIWGGYSQLLSLLKERNGFAPKEILIFSETRVLVLLENEKQVYFRLDQDLISQVQILEFVYGRLMIDSVEFKEIDLRFKRPVIRK